MFGNLSIYGAAFETLHSTVILGILAACSLVCFALIVERLLYFRKISAEPEDLLLELRGLLSQGKFDDALKSLRSVGASPVAAVIEAGIKNCEMPKEHLGEMMRACQMKQRSFMEQRLVVLGTLGNVAPFIGLLGTVMGIIQAFQDLASPEAQANGASVVATGIAEALIATAAGLVVAIPAVVFYNYFLKRVKQVMTDMEVATIETTALLTLRESCPRGGTRAS